MATQTATTLDNLQTAYNGESNARAKYHAFSKKADQEGYAKVARLFRAAARAEEIHASNHAAVIRKMGSEPVCRIEEPGVRSTAENLQVAIEGEVYERDVMYPKFLEQARREKNAAAIRAFHLALSVEAEHAKLYTDSSKNLDAWRMATTPIYVCADCGSTRLTLDFQKCGVCGAPVEKFEEIL